MLINFRQLFKKRQRFVLYWSDYFKAYQVYRLDKWSKPYYMSYYSPSYFVGWATLPETDYDKLNKNEFRVGGKCNYKNNAN